MVHGFYDGYVRCNAASQGKYCADFNCILFTRYYISRTFIFHLSAVIPLCCMINLQQSLKNHKIKSSMDKINNFYYQVSLTGS